MNFNKEDFKLAAVIAGSAGCIANVFYLLYLQYQATEVPSIASLYLHKYYLLPLIFWLGLVIWGSDSKTF